LEEGMMREFAGSAQTLPGPSSRSSPGAFAGDHNSRDWTDRHADGDPEIMADALPDNEWILNAQYAAEGHHHNPRAVYEKFPLPPETRKVFEKATTGPLQFVGGTRMMLSIAHIARLSANSWTGLCRIIASKPNK
jgi:hypothetical protein